MCNWQAILMLYSDRNILITCHICANNSIFSGCFRFVENANAPLVQEKTTVTVYFTVIRTDTELTWERSSVIYNFDKCYTKIKSIPSRLSTLNHNSATKQISRWWKSITNKFEKHITLIIIVKLMNLKLLRETYIHLWNRYWAVFADHFLGQFPIYNKEQNCI